MSTKAHEDGMAHVCLGYPRQLYVHLLMIELLHGAFNFLQPESHNVHCYMG